MRFQTIGAGDIDRKPAATAIDRGDEGDRAAGIHGRPRRERGEGAAARRRVAVGRQRLRGLAVGREDGGVGTACRSTALKAIASLSPSAMRSEKRAKMPPVGEGLPAAITG